MSSWLSAGSGRERKTSSSKQGSGGMAEHAKSYAQSMVTQREAILKEKEMIDKKIAKDQKRPQLGRKVSSNSGNRRISVAKKPQAASQASNAKAVMGIAKYVAQK